MYVPTIPLTHVVIDNLTFSCVPINLLITELCHQDSIEQRKQFSLMFLIGKL